MSEENKTILDGEEVENVEEAAEEKAVEAEETVEETAETVEEAAPEAEETAKEEVKETVKKAPEKAKPSSKAKPEIKIKKKKGLSKTNVIIIIVAAVIVLACIGYIGYIKGWFHVPAKASITMEDHTTIEIDESAVEVTDDDIEGYLEDMQDEYTTTEQVTEGTVEDGDVLYISYVGTIDGEEFDGGTSDGTSLTIGSGSFIDGFEDGLIGQEIGSTVTLDLTFPEDYKDEDSDDAWLNGQPVQFEVTIEYRTDTNVPEMTDEFVEENSLEYIGEQIDTVDDLETYFYDYYTNYYLHNEMLTAFEDKTTVKSYDEEYYELFSAYFLEELEYYASNYGTTADYLAQLYGQEDADGYAASETEYYLKRIYVLDYLANEVGYTYTQEDIDASIQEYMDDNGYSDSYTLDEFKEEVGEVWLYMYEKITYRVDDILDQFEDRVVYVESEEETTTEETTAAE